MLAPSRPGPGQPQTEKCRPGAPSARPAPAGRGDRPPCPSLLRAPSAPAPQGTGHLNKRHITRATLFVSCPLPLCHGHSQPLALGNGVAAPTTARLAWAAFSHKRFLKEEFRVSSRRWLSQLSCFASLSKPVFPVINQRHPINPAFRKDYICVI